MLYAGVIVNNKTDATDGIFVYGCPFSDAKIGQKVIVPFGIHERHLEGYIAAFYDNAPAGVRKLKKIESLCEDEILGGEIMETAAWMHSRYMCRYIDAVKCFLPAAGEARGKTKDPFADLELSPDSAKKLTDEQAAALAPVCEKIEKSEHKIFLLNGVTGSGKTEVYLQAMAKCIERGKSGIVLVPEIALTPQTVSRFTNRFGRENVAILHSKLTKLQRAAEYKKIQNGEVKMVIGARSAIFAPFQNLGLIIIDEEHETSYKADNSPKYDAIEVAAKRAMLQKACLVLGSATPAVADYYRAKEGLFTELRLKERYNQTPLPKISLVDMRSEVRAGNRTMFSKALAQKIQSNLGGGKQVILFLNRRGYSNFVNCRECGHTVKCPDCGIAMTYHKSTNAMVCHYCGRKQPQPLQCPECGSELIGKYGVGTEQLEEKIAELFPSAKVARLDVDSIKKKGSMESILKNFANGKIDILIGTQLVAKGLDFQNVGLVGIINADVSLNIPDYRSSERCYQLITQVAGRAGRGAEQGEVVVQTYTPDSPAITAAVRGSYEEFYYGEIKLRHAAAYPPFWDIFQLVLSSESEDAARSSAQALHKMLSEELAGKPYRILGVTKTPVAKLAGQYRFQIIIKAPKGSRMALAKIINDVRPAWNASSKSLLTTDINPYSIV